MKSIKQIITVSLFTFIFLGSFIADNASAKFTNPLGEALCNPSLSAIKDAKAYNAFKVGQRVDLSSTFNLTKTMRVEKVVGSVHGATVAKAGFDYSTYLNKIRGLNQTAGKIFEESFCRSFNRSMKNGNCFVENTAILGKSHDSADLLVINKATQKVEFKIQQKLSADLAIDAITNPKNIEKYKDCKYILTTSDQLEYIKMHLHRYSAEKRQLLEKAIQDERLTDNILGIHAKRMDHYQDLTKRIYKPIFNKMREKMVADLSSAIQRGEDFIMMEGKPFSVEKALDLYRNSKIFNTEIEAALREVGKVSEGMYKLYFDEISDEVADALAKAIRKGEEFVFLEGKTFYVDDAIEIYRGSKTVSPEIESALRKVQRMKNFNKIVGIAGSILDIGQGFYMIYSAQSQFEKGLLDADLSNYKKMLGVVQIGVGVVGLVMVFSPDPFSKIAAPVVVVVGVLVAALDMWIDHIQAQRVAARQRMMERITAQDRPRAIRELLIKDMNIQCAL